MRHGRVSRHATLDLRRVWSDFFDGTVPGSEALLERIRERYCVAAMPQHVVFIDDLLENVLAARSIGIRAFQFVEAQQLTRELAADGLLAP